jgi:ABC-type multidrug transport system ATPase subunit
VEDDPSDEPLLSLLGATREYGEVVALAPLDLDVRRGECLAVVGPNGSGKSTLLRLMAGREIPTAGQVTFAGARIDENGPAVREQMAVVAGPSAFYPDLTTREHLEFVALGHGVPDVEEVVDDALAWSRLTDHADKFPGVLSAGQQQSLRLAAVLVRPRTLLILDEPEQHLDPAARGRLADLLRAETDAGVAIVLATHQIEVARSAADRALVLRDGFAGSLSRDDLTSFDGDL